MLAQVVVQCRDLRQPRECLDALRTGGSRGPLKIRLESDQEASGFAARHDAMVKGERQLSGRRRSRSITPSRRLSRQSWPSSMPSPAALTPNRPREPCKPAPGRDNAALNCSELPQDGGATSSRTSAGNGKQSSVASASCAITECCVAAEYRDVPAWHGRCRAS